DWFCFGARILVAPRCRHCFHYDATAPALSDSVGPTIGPQGGARSACDPVAWRRGTAEDRDRDSRLLFPDLGECRGRIRSGSQGDVGFDALAARLRNVDLPTFAHSDRDAAFVQGLQG